MKSATSAQIAALNASRDSAIMPVRFAWFEGADASWGLGLWTWDEDIQTNVISGTTGLPVTRTYYGGCNLVIGDIPYVSDLTIQRVSVSMSQIADAAQELVRGRDLRLARCEIHEMQIDLDTGELAATPEIIFLGVVDGAPVSTPEAGAEGGITITIASEALLMLSRTNPRKSSHESQKRRSGDQFSKYASTVGSWDIPWYRKGAD